MRLTTFWGIFTVVWLIGCSNATRTRGALPPAQRSYTLGPGDRFEVVIVGEEKLPKDFSVAPDGTVDFPWVRRLLVTGLEPQQVAGLLREELVKQGYLREPNVIVSIREFSSKRVLVGGQVNKPGDVAYSPGLSLNRLIISAGGFTANADRNNVLVTRRLSNGQTRTVSFSVNAIAEGRSQDIPLQAGDSIYVDEKAF